MMDREPVDNLQWCEIVMGSGTYNTDCGELRMYGMHIGVAASSVKVAQRGRTCAKT